MTASIFFIGPGLRTSQGAVAGLAGADADPRAGVRHEALAVAALAGPGGPAARVDGGLRLFVGDDDLELRLRQEIARVLGPAVLLLVALLSAEPADFGDRHALDADLGQGVLD